jgi:hypothetical protein
MYALRSAGEEVVIKRFNENRPEALTREWMNLGAVKTLGSLVPRVLGTVGDVLILQPVGDKFASSVHSMVLSWPGNHQQHTTALSDANFNALFTRQDALANLDDFVQLINILEQAHRKCGLVHRDVRLNNFFRIKGTTQVHSLP